MFTYASEDERAVLRAYSGLEPHLYPLSPAQQKARDAILEALGFLDIVILQSDPGAGKTSILKAVAAKDKGVVTGLAQFVESLKNRNPIAIEEAFLDTLEEAIGSAGLVIIDDLHLIQQIAANFNYTRQNLLDAGLKALLERAGHLGKKLVFATESGFTPLPLAIRALPVKLEAFQAADYQAICSAFLRRPDHIDFAAVHRFAPKLNAHQLRTASITLDRDTTVDAEKFIEFLRARNMASNVDLEEVPPVDWNQLKGVDDVIRALETKIAFPFENADLAASFGLKPKRGVLLAGPPGTGKTTIGRALAHRLKSKFFLVDGTVVAGSGDFYCEIGAIFEAAKRNAPSILFIDDADVIFDDKSENGFYRYLLTMLDGLKSASASRVCVMMTAMEVSSLPPALVRSGRIELWLETRLPDLVAREIIFRESLASLPEPVHSVDPGQLARASASLSGADIKAVVEDAKLEFAYARATRAPECAVEEYFFRAIQTVKTNRSIYQRKKPKPFGVESKFGFERAALD